MSSFDVGYYHHYYHYQPLCMDICRSIEFIELISKISENKQKQKL